MMKKSFERYEKPSVEWLVSPEEEFVLCQSPQTDEDGLGEIGIGGEEGEEQGWLN